MRITKSILHDRDLCVLSDLMAQTVHRNPNITAFHPRRGPGDYGSLIESLATCMRSDHCPIHTHYMAAHLVDVNPPTSLRFSSSKPKPATFNKEGWYKDAAKRKLLLSDPASQAKRPSPSTLSLVAHNGSGTQLWV